MPYPAGVVAPSMIIGGLLGRTVAVCLPEVFIDFVLTPLGGVSEVTDDMRGAFMARIAIICAAAFCSGVCRAFAMAITVFEVLALPSALLPLCVSSLVAMFVADKIALPYFDTNLVGRGLGGISALTHGTRAQEPAFDRMRRLHLKQNCVEQHMTLARLRTFLDESDEEFVPIVQHVVETWTDGGVVGLLRGSIARESLETLLVHTSFHNDDSVIDLLDPDLVMPKDRSEPVVQLTPQHCSPATLMQDIYLMMKVSNVEVVYVTDDNCLLGVITWKEILGHKL